MDKSIIIFTVGFCEKCHKKLGIWAAILGKCKLIDNKVYCQTCASIIENEKIKTEINELLNREKYQYSPPPNPPNIVKIFRKKYKNTHPSKLVSLYYNFLDKIQHSKDENEKIQYCLLSLPLIEPLIKETVEEYGLFDITSIPAIEYAIKYWKQKKARGQLLNLKDIIYYFPELEKWKPLIDEAMNSLGQ